MRTDSSDRSRDRDFFFYNFKTFFLIQLYNTGLYAEKLKGTCKEVGSQDTLYMEINVQTEGYLKDAKIQINIEYYKKVYRFVLFECFDVGL